MSQVVVHVAGELEDGLVQRCVRCGEIICDYRGAMVMRGQSLPNGWPVGAEIANSGNHWVAIEGEHEWPPCEAPERGDYEHERADDDECEDWGLPELEGW